MCGKGTHTPNPPKSLTPKDTGHGSLGRRQLTVGMNRSMVPPSGDGDLIAMTWPKATPWGRGHTSIS